MPSKSTLYYCCLCDLFILLRNIPSVERGGDGSVSRGREGGVKCTGCNSPWTSIILDFSTGWSSMQKGHFLSTKIKTIMMIKKTCAIRAGMAARVGVRYFFFLQGKTLRLCSLEFVYKIIYTGADCSGSCAGKQKKNDGSWCWWKKCHPGITDTYLTSQSRGPQPRSEQRGNTHGFNSTHPLTDADRYLWDEAFRWLIGQQEIRALEALHTD